MFQPRAVGVVRSNTMTSKDHEPHHHHAHHTDETEAQKRAIAADSLLMVGLVEKINDMHSKMNELAQVVTRVDQMDQRLANVERLVTESRRNVEQNSAISAVLASSNAEMTKLGQKMTLIETELLIIKQNLAQQQTRTSRLSYDSNDTTTYETPHQSFMMTSPKASKNDTSGGSGFGDLNESSHGDITLNSTDLTPTMPECITSGASRLASNGQRLSSLGGGKEDDLNINRARDLLQRASLLSSTMNTNGTQNLVA